MEEIIEFSKRMGFHKIGIATCIGLIEESRIFAQILRKNGFEPHAALCKAGALYQTKAYYKKRMADPTSGEKNDNFEAKNGFQDLNERERKLHKGSESKYG